MPFDIVVNANTAISSTQAAATQRSTFLVFLLKAFQSIIPPRSILVFSLLVLAMLTTFIPFLSCEKWWMLLIVLLVGMYIAIPSSMRNKQLIGAIKEVPYFIIAMVINLFSFKGASKKFIHTSHGDNISS